MKKYKTLCGKLDVKEIERETEKMVFFSNGQREHKRSSWQNYFDTWEEAKQFLIDEAKLKVRHAQSRLDSCKAKLKLINDLKKPKND
jgi:hypothetical protein